MPHISARCFGSLCLPGFAWPWSAGLHVLQEKVAPSWMHLGWECEKFINGRPRFPVNPLTARFGWLRVPGDELVSDRLTRYRLRFGATGLIKDRLCCKQHGLQHHNSYIQGQPQHLGGVLHPPQEQPQHFGGDVLHPQQQQLQHLVPQQTELRLFCFWCVFFFIFFLMRIFFLVRQPFLVGTFQLSIGYHTFAPSVRSLHSFCCTS